MPPKSEKQRRFMEMILHSKKKPSLVGPSKEVARKILEHKPKSK